MKDFIEKLIERLEEIYNRNDKAKKEAYEEREWEYFDLFMHRNEGVYTSISIANQLAEEYINTSTDTSSERNKALDSLHKKILSNPKMCEIVTEEEIMALVEAKNNGWIPCSDRLPDEDGTYLVQQDDEKINILCYCNGWNCTYMDVDKTRWSNVAERKNIVAWQSLPLLSTMH